MDDFYDKRKDCRDPLDVAARYRLFTEAGAAEVPGFEPVKIINISEMGLGLVSRDRIQPGSVLDIEIDLNGQNAVSPKPVRVYCLTKWCERIKAGLYKTGVDFIVIKQEDIGELYSFCHRY